MKRYATEYLKEWKQRPGRKPVVIRGARQVGKSYLVRMFGEECFENFIEINFEQDMWAEDQFAAKSPADTVAFLETQYKQRIVAGKTLLFLDEIQAGPKALVSLRYFYEQMPELHIIAVGSLLDFVLEKHEFSMPVGRIEYLHLGPMTFDEFLLATNNEIKLERLAEFSFAGKFDELSHSFFMEDFRKYCIIGGMPGAIREYLNTGSYLEVQRVLEGILATYQDDFNKYAGRVEHSLLCKVFSRLPMVVGQKLKYTNIDRHEKSRTIAGAFHLLELAKIVHRVNHSYANGIPLGAEINERDFKAIFLDIGLLCRACRLDLAEMLNTDDIMLINSGAICEQFVGQHLLYDSPLYQQPELYCWMRQKEGTTSEVDYLIQQGLRIIPVEVKAGKTGRLKSLHVFVLEKGHNLAVRFNADVPSVVDAQTAIAGKPAKPYRLLSIPFYMIGQARRLIKEAIELV